jgi:hypothetical protein
VPAKFLILDPEIEMRLGVARIFADLFHAERQIQMLLLGDAFFAPDLAVVMKNYRYRRELKMRQATRVDDLVN